MSTLRVCLPKNPTSAKRHLLLHHSRTTPPPLDLLLVCKDFETFFAVLSIVRSPLPQIRGILAHYLQQRCPPQQTLLLPPSSSTPTTVAADGTNPDHYHYHHQQQRVLVVPQFWHGTQPWLQCPNNSWGSRILFLAEEKKSLQVTSAYVSTLGGGYFMCRFVGKAQDMARTQLKVAEKLGDEVLQSKCRTHLIYNDIQLGDFDVAQMKLATEMNFACRLNDTELISIIKSAIHYCDQCRELNKTLAPVEVGTCGDGSRFDGGKVGVEDEYYRMRVVKLKVST